MNFAEYVKVCKRLNNTKRNFLVLNEAQCKHVPSSPMLALDMFSELATKLNDYANQAGVLVIGFAETATAIGASVASCLNCDYIHTTREDIPSDYFVFTESHSHAVEQRLSEIDFSKYATIVIVEDEVTTGNTILKLVDKIKHRAPHVDFVVASLLNGMSDSAAEGYIKRGIKLFYLVKLDNTEYPYMANAVVEDGTCRVVNGESSVDTHSYTLCDPRLCCNINKYVDALETVNQSVGLERRDNVLVVGTEECMYPAVLLGAYLELHGNNVRCHSTTRSPICVSNCKEYPLHTRTQLISCYDDSRVTYIYNLDKYDRVFIVSDAPKDSSGIKQLTKALIDAGNSDILHIALERRF